ncbi:MAG TPA: thioredoxin-like domain-containing protein [Puia sp.]|jgi:thiol-disulfide isomerase/thioredoxin|nr:thioredoxin-like domain-containing protein [Puia sp.]
MSKNVLLLAACLLMLKAYSQNGYNIHLHLKPYTSGKVYLGYYYGKIKALADSAQLNGSSDGLFSGENRLPGGVYFIVSPNRAILFELLIDSQQHFSVSADTTNLPGSVTFTGSPDNTIFQTYTRYTAEKGRQITADQAAMNNARKSGDSVTVRANREKIRQLNDEIIKYREELMRKYPTTLLATLFQALKEPEIPPASKQPGGKYDSAFAFRYFKDHYWDGLSFGDERLARTPVFEPRLDKYYRELVAPEPDSIEKEVDRMLLESRVSKAMFQYLMVYFVQKYVTPEYMGQDAVFVHLFDKYINSGETEFFTEKYRKYLDDRAYSMMANLIGEPAANLEMVDTNGALRPLYGVNANYIIVCFWDPTCSHCKEVVPKLDSMYKAKWKAEGVKIYGVMVDGGREQWLQFIKDHNLSDWTHVYETKEHQEATEKAGQPGFRQLYDVYQTPTLYLLDKDKRIIAKKLSFEQLDEVINLKLQHAKSK